jgi:hypothetical protein
VCIEESNTFSIATLAIIARDALTSHTKRKKKKSILPILLETKKWLIIVKFDYYEPFVYFVGDALNQIKFVNGINKSFLIFLND